MMYEVYDENGDFYDIYFYEDEAMDAAHSINGTYEEVGE